MSEQQKIFVSHHHDDARELGKLKELLQEFGIDAFIAHEDIKPGQHDLVRIQEELQACDIFLLVGQDDARDSVFVNQEIGFALGKRKKIISTIRKGSSTWGFIARQQAIPYQNIEDTKLFNELLKEIAKLAESKHYLGEKRNALVALGVESISINSRSGNNWNLEIDDSGWSDYGFQPYCFLNKGIDQIAIIKMAHADFPNNPEPRRLKNWPRSKNQIKEFLPSDHLSFLDKRFFSRIKFDDKERISLEQRAAIQCVFNDIEAHKDIAQQYARRAVTEVSLFKPSEYPSFLEGVEISTETSSGMKPLTSN